MTRSTLAIKENDGSMFAVYFVANPTPIFLGKWVEFGAAFTF